MRLLITVILFNLTLVSQAQEKVLLSGMVRDMVTYSALPSVHVINSNDSMATISNLQGIFRMTVRVGDTLHFSSIAYNKRSVLVTDSIIALSPFYVGLSLRVYELGEVTVNPLGSKTQFRKDFMDLQLADDKLHVNGLPDIEVSGIPVWEDANEIKKAKYLLNPISYIYYNTNRHAKARQKYRSLVASDQKLTKARKKFTADMVTEITGLTGDTLQEFISYCRFSDQYLVYATQYEITQVMLTRYDLFMKQVNAIKEDQ